MDPLCSLCAGGWGVDRPAGTHRPDVVVSDNPIMHLLRFLVVLPVLRWQSQPKLTYQLLLSDPVPGKGVPKTKIRDMVNFGKRLH